MGGVAHFSSVNKLRVPRFSWFWEKWVLVNDVLSRDQSLDLQNLAHWPPHLSSSHFSQRTRENLS